MVGMIIFRRYLDSQNGVTTLSVRKSYSRHGVFVIQSRAIQRQRSAQIG